MLRLLAYHCFWYCLCVCVTVSLLSHCRAFVLSLEQPARYFVPLQLQYVNERLLTFRTSSRIKLNTRLIHAKQL